MKRIAMKSLLLASVLGLGACATRPLIDSQSRAGTDFTAYRSYAYVEQPGTDKTGYSTILTSHFKAAVDREMAARGYVLDAANPDLLVNFFSNVETRSESYSTPTVRMGYYGYRGGVIAVPLYGEDVSTRNYRVGTVNIDVVDAKRKELVWEGVLEGALSRKAMRDPAGAVRSAVSQIFQRYPVAASAAPAQ